MVAKAKKPDLGPGFSLLPGLVSNRYAKRKFDQILRNCHSLDALDTGIISKITSNEFAVLKNARKLTLYSIPLYVAYFVATARFPTNSGFDTLINLLVSFLLVAAFLVLIFIIQRSMYEELSGSKLLNLIYILEQNEGYWQDSEFRWTVAKRMEACARNIERIPVALRRVSPGVRRQAFMVSQRKAQAIRNFEMSLVIPDDSTRSNLVSIFTTSLICMVEGRWYDLPEAKYEPIRSRTLVAMEVSAAVFSLAGAAALITLASKIGPVSSIFSPLLIGAALAFLNMAGLPLNVIERYSQAGKQIASKR